MPEIWDYPSSRLPDFIFLSVRALKFIQARIKSFRAQREIETEIPPSTHIHTHARGSLMPTRTASQRRRIIRAGIFLIGPGNP